MNQLPLAYEQSVEMIHKGSGRIQSLDLFRGLLVAGMIIVNFLLPYDAGPTFLKHALPLGGITIVDFGAPLFFFLIGITFAISIENRLRKRKHTFVRLVFHFIKRYGLLWLFGLIGVFVVERKIIFDWNVLMAIGAAGLIALPFMFLSSRSRFISGLWLLFIYQFVVLRFFFDSVIHTNMGGTFGAVSWSSMILLASYWWPFCKMNESNKLAQELFVHTLTAGLLGIFLSTYYPANKPIVSISFIILSYGGGTLLLSVFLFIERFSKWEMSFLYPFGQNPLYIYMLSGVLTITIQRWIPFDAAWPIVVVSCVVLFIVCYYSAVTLRARKIFIKL